jgi:hypothetical protein
MSWYLSYRVLIVKRHHPPDHEVYMLTALYPYLYVL